MPKRSAPPKPAVEVNPQFAKRPGVEVVEVIYLPDASLTDAMAADLRSALVRKQLDELSELLGNALLVAPSAAPAIISDAQRRVSVLRLALGL